ncbi:MAG TPA: carboxypeptidase-like regulatory domain-containing protein, partial [Bacteroidales bacterium]|nr:carboxypeptidase-like regulatory domain-containing protein [Bacteroidales bacterium]
MKHIILLITLGFVIPGSLSAQKYTLSGHIIDGDNGENLIGVGIYLKGSNTGVVTNSYGFYSVSLRPGMYNFLISYIGYETIDTVIRIQQNMRIDFEMKIAVKELNEVVIKAESSDDKVNSTQMSTVTLSNKTMKQIPVAFGEADLLKTLVLLPG